MISSSRNKNCKAAGLGIADREVTEATSYLGKYYYFKLQNLVCKENGCHCGGGHRGLVWQDVLVVLVDYKQVFVTEVALF